MIGLCPICDSRARLTDVGLCRRCRDELRFVVRPVAHREMYRRGFVEMCDIHAAMERAGVAIISSLPDDNGLWLCDLCNVEIPVTGEHILIPLLGSYALCIPCASSFPYWPDGWTQPAPRACRCGACQRPVLSALARIS